MAKSNSLGEFIRYVVNGVAATCIHYAVLWINLHWLGFTSAGLANFAAALVGICTSFAGNRLFVFRHARQSAWHGQMVRFFILYLCIALLHGAVMWIWADHLKQDYRIGFILATCMQFVLSYLGNKVMVFRHES